MSSTVTSQAELDSALTDDSITEIVIDAPRGVWITISDSHSKRLDVAGESRIESVYGSASVGSVRDSASVGSVYDSASVEYVGDSASVEYVYDSARVEYVGDSARVEYVGDSASVGSVYGSASVESVGDSARVEYVGDSARVGSVYGSASVEYVRDSARVGSVRGSARVEYVRDSASVESVCGSARVGSVRGSARVEYVRDSASVEYVRDSARVGSVYGSASVEKAVGGTVIQGVYDQAVVHAGPYVSVHLYSAAATVEGGHVIDLTGLADLDGPDWCEFHGIDVDRLRGEIQWATDHSEEWDQSTWAQKIGDGCGTRFCLAGGTVLHAGIQMRWEAGAASTTVDGRPISEAARDLLGLSNQDAGRLFKGSNSLEALWTLAAEITHGAIQVPESLTSASA